METATRSDAAAGTERITTIDWGLEPGQDSFERFYRQITDRDDLPSIPEVARQLMMAVNRETTTGRELASLIGRDQSLAAKLLRLANSAFFGLQRTVTDLGQAVTLLGFGHVRDLVMTLSLWGSIGDGDPTTTKRRKPLWIHCASVAAAAKLLAKKVGRMDVGEALSAGLLHDIGKLLLGLRLGATYWEMIDQAEEMGTDPTMVELDAFGIHHGTVGQYLLQLWSLPETLSQAVSEHHEPLEIEPGSTVGVGHVVNAANRIVHLLAHGGEEEEAGAILEALAPGKLRADMWPAMRDDLEAEQEQIAGFFGRS
jgi:putative nucleotidyltransferase with HDIG domain